MENLKKLKYAIMKQEKHKREVMSTKEEQLIKSKHRVQKHGEVFTPAWMVQKMLDTPGVKGACEDIYATFLEPSAIEIDCLKSGGFKCIILL